MVVTLKKWWKWLLGIVTVGAVLASGEMGGPLPVTYVERIADGYEKVCSERATGKLIPLQITAEEYAKAPTWAPAGYEKCLYARQYTRYLAPKGELPDMTYGDAGGGQWQVVYKGKTFNVPQNVTLLQDKIDALDSISTTSSQ